MYAIVATGGKQYRVSEGTVIHVESLDVAEGAQVELDHVLMVGGDDNVTVGSPTVDGAKVTATVEKHGRGKKVIVYKHKKNYKRKQGHRQNYTRLHIDSIQV